MKIPSENTSPFSKHLLSLHIFHGTFNAFFWTQMTKKHYKRRHNSSPSYPNSFLRPDFTIRKSTSFVSVSSLCNLFIFLSRALCGCETFSNVTGRLVLSWVQAKITTLMKFKIKHDTGFKQARKRFEPIKCEIGISWNLEYNFET